MKSFRIRPVAPEDHAWVVEALTEWWDSPVIDTRGRVHHADRLPGFIAETEEVRHGLVTYHIEKGECEIISLNTRDENVGIGTALLEAVKKTAWDRKCRRLWLVTSNDNTDAMRFYQMRGMRMVAVHRDAIEFSRKLNPSIPLTGKYGIPLRDEIEFEMLL